MQKMDTMYGERAEKTHEEPRYAMRGETFVVLLHIVNAIGGNILGEK